MNIQVKNVLMLICNLFILVSLILCEVTFFRRVGDGNMKVSGTSSFMYFTVDSNILMALVSAVCLFFNVRNIICASGGYPSWMVTLYHAGTNAVTLTFVVVVVFLGPMMGYRDMFAGINLYMHLINPLVAIASFIFLMDCRPVSMWSCLIATVPTLIYGSVYMYKVIIVGAANGGWKDFYGFNIGGFWYISAIVVPLASFGLAAALKALHNVVARV